MSTKPATLPTWNTGGANRSAPSGGQAVTGFATGDQVPSSWFNHWLYWIFSWLEYVRDAAFSSTTSDGASGTTSHAAHSGLNGTHTGGGAAVSGTSSSGIGGAFSGGTAGVAGDCSAVGYGVKGTTGDVLSPGVWGVNSGGGFGVRGESTAGDPNAGVYGGVASASSTADNKAVGVKGVSASRASATYTYGVLGQFLGGGSGGTAAGVKADGSAGAYGLIAVGCSVNTPLRLVPQGYTAGTGPSGSLEGDIFFNGTDHKLYFYNGTSWVSTT